MGALTALLIFVGMLVYIFFPEKNPFRQRDKTRVDYLRERKESIYENLRDLNFEYLAGKYPEPDYIAQRSGLEDEAAGVIAEVEVLERDIENSPVKSSTTAIQDPPLVVARLTREVNRDVCPRCLEQVKSAAFVCAHCNFEIAKYVENKMFAKLTEMTRSSRNHQFMWMRSLYKGNGLLWIGYVIVGILAFFIPIVGVFISSLLLITAFIMFIFPVTGPMMADFIGNRHTYNVNKLLARQLSQNTYTDVSCPACSSWLALTKKNTVFAWRSGENQSITCSACGKVSLRIHQFLLWLPHPSISLSGNLSEYISNE